MVKDSRTIAEVLPKFLTFIEKLPLVAHNTEFDYGFMKSACASIGKKFARKHICTMKLYKRIAAKERNEEAKEEKARYREEYGSDWLEYYLHDYEPKKKSAKLGSVVSEFLWIEHQKEYEENAHRALTDALTVHRLYDTLLAEKYWLKL